MKKALSFIIAIVILIVSCIPVFAEEKADIVIDMAEVIYYDKNASASDSPFLGSVKIIAVFREIERFKYCRVNVDFNTDLLQYETSVDTPVMTYIAGCSPTDSGIVFSARLGDMAVAGESYSCTSTGYLKVKGTGNHNIKLNVDVRDVDGNPVDVKVEFNQPYEKITDVSEVEFIDRDKLTMKYTSAYMSMGSKVKDLLDIFDEKNIVINSIDGKTLDADDRIPTGAYIATMYEGFIVDRVDICVMYDVDCDGKVTAADARTALRHSARIELISGVQYAAAEVNSDNRLTAADARLILRKAAKID